MSTSDLVRQILAEGSQPPPIDAERLAVFRKKFQRLFGIELPTAYEEVLLLCDGLEYNGLMIYGSRTSKGRYPVSGVRAENRVLRGDRESMGSWRVLAYSTEAYLAYNTELASWAMVMDFNFEVLESETGDGDGDRLLQRLLELALGMDSW